MIPLAVEPAAAALLERCAASGQAVVGTPRAAAPAGAVHPDRTPYLVAGSTAVVPVDGPIWFSPNLFSALWGGCSSGAIAHALAAANADEAVARVVLDVHSPGGDCCGMDDLARAVRTSAKPVIVYARDMLASGAYWMAAGARAIWGTPGCIVGSIGAYAVANDTTAAAEKAGERAIVRTTRRRKILNIFGVAPDEGALADMERMVRAASDRFDAAVTAGRGIDAAALAAMDGGLFYGTEAVTAGLVDGIAPSDEFWAMALDGRLDSTPTTQTTAQPVRRAAATAPLAVSTNTAGATTMTTDEIKSALDEMEPEERRALLAEYAEEPDEDEKDEDDAQAAAPGSPAPGSAPVAFAELDAMVSKRFPDRDAFIARCQRRGLNATQVRAEMDDELIERANNAVAVRGEEVAAAARGSDAAIGGGGRVVVTTPATYADAIAMFRNQGKSLPEASKLANEQFADLRRASFGR